MGEAVTRQDNVQGEDRDRKTEPSRIALVEGVSGVPVLLATQVEAKASTVPRSAGFSSGSELASFPLISRCLPGPNRVVSPNRVPPTTEQETWRSGASRPQMEVLRLS